MIDKPMQQLTDNSELQSRLELALGSSSRAGELILGYYQNRDLQIDLKGDQSPVTLADRGAELLLRKEIQKNFPEDGILGEEFDEVKSQNGYKWILDPIDGTKSFIYGVPLFGTLVGVEFEGTVVVGVSRFPALNEVVYAVQGGGTWWQQDEKEPGRAAMTSVSALKDALFCTTTLTGWKTIGKQGVYEQLLDHSKLARGWGDCYGHCLVATGRADLMVDPQMSPWDAAALLPIMQEAGGCFLDWNGEASIYTGNSFSANPALKDEVLTILQSED